MAAKERVIYWPIRHQAVKYLQHNIPLVEGATVRTEETHSQYGCWKVNFASS